MLADTVARPDGTPAFTDTVAGRTWLPVPARARTDAPDPVPPWALTDTLVPGLAPPQPASTHARAVPAGLAAPARVLPVPDARFRLPAQPARAHPFAVAPLPPDPGGWPPPDAVPGDAELDRPPQLASTQALTLAPPDPGDCGPADCDSTGCDPADWPAALDVALTTAAGLLDPGAADPGGAESGAAEPGADADVADPDAADPGVAEPGAAEPGVAELGAADPGAGPVDVDPGRSTSATAESGRAELLDQLLDALAEAVPVPVAEPVPPQRARAQAVTVTPGDGLPWVAACAAEWPSSSTPPMLAATIRPRSRVFMIVVPSEGFACWAWPVIRATARGWPEGRKPRRGVVSEPRGAEGTSRDGAGRAHPG